MNRRLQQFLELEQLSSSRLADTLGIQRSGISHILSGRNKPSFDFIYKFIQKFPQINAEWLITGKGKPYKDNTSPSAPLFPEKSPESEQILPFEENEENIPINNPKDNFIVSPADKEPQKRILRAVIFYSDGSFEDLFPDK